MGDYLNTVYNIKDRPYTDYPGKLIHYLFNTFNLKPSKKSEKFSYNRGRVFATQAGIDLAAGNWCLFVQK